MTASLTGRPHKERFGCEASSVARRMPRLGMPEPFRESRLPLFDVEPLALDGDELDDEIASLAEALAELRRQARYTQFQLVRLESRREMLSVCRQAVLFAGGSL